jgi:hypothetical protein
MKHEQSSSLFHILLFVYALVGITGTILFVDEFDGLRTSTVTFFAVPFSVAYFFLYFQYPILLQKFSTTRILCLTYLFFAYGSGVFLVLNALGDGQEPVEIAQPIGKEVGNVAHFKGPLGIIYRSRF